MPRVRWTPEEDERLVGLIAAGKSWTSISGTLKRSMKSVELHANTLRLVGAKNERGLKEMRAARLQAMEETGAALQANARKLPSGPDRDELLQDIGKFRGQVAVLQSGDLGPHDEDLRTKGKLATGFHSRYLRYRQLETEVNAHADDQARRKRRLLEDQKSSDVRVDRKRN